MTIGSQLDAQERERKAQAAADWERRRQAGMAWAWSVMGKAPDRPDPSILDVIAAKAGSRRVAASILRELEARGLIRETAP